MNSTFQKAKVLYDLKRFDEALVMLHKAHLEEPSNVEIYTITAWCYYLTKRAANGFQVAGNGLKIDPQNIRVLIIHAVCASYIGKFKVATNSLNSALALDPQNGFAHYQRAFHLVKQQRPKEALESISLAISFDPGSPVYHSFRSEIQSMLGENQDAKKSALKALSVNPQVAHGHLQLGRIQRGEGNLHDSLDSLMEALRNDPNNEAAREELLDTLRCRFLPYRWVVVLDHWLIQFPYWKRALFWTSPLSIGGLGLLGYSLLELNGSFGLSKFVLGITLTYDSLFVARCVLKHHSSMFLDGLVAFNREFGFVVPRAARLVSKATVVFMTCGIVLGLVGAALGAKLVTAIGISLIVAAALIAFAYSLVQTLNRF